MPQTRAQTDAGRRQPGRGSRSGNQPAAGTESSEPGDEQRDRTRNPPPPVANENQSQPLSHDPQTSSTSPHNHHPNGQQRPAPVNPVRSNRMGEPFHPQPTSTPSSSGLQSSSNQLTQQPRHVSNHTQQSRLPLPASMRDPRQAPAHTVRKQPRMPRQPRGISKQGLKQSMGLHKAEKDRHAYNKFRDRVRAKMKELGEGLWVAWDDVPKRFKDWLVHEVMNDPSIPFIQDYGDWAVLNAARRTAGRWRNSRYKDGTLQVPENKQYLAANSAKRNPHAPRGARFPARPSKPNPESTPDNDPSNTGGSDDGRVPVLPSGSSAAANSGWMSNVTANPTLEPSSNYCAQPIPGPSQLPFSGWQFPQTHTSPPSSFIPWDASYQPNIPQPGPFVGDGYRFYPPNMQDDPRAPRLCGRHPSSNNFINQGPSQAAGASYPGPNPPLVPFHPQPQQNFNQPFIASPSSSSGLPHGPFSAQYCFTPGNSDMCYDSRQPRPPNRGSSHTDGPRPQQSPFNAPRSPSSAPPQPAQVNDDTDPSEPHQKSPGQGRHLTDEHDPH